MIRAAIVILNWNGDKFLQQFLPSVLKYSSIPGIEVYVADNGSTDNSIEILKSQFPSVKIIQFNRNYGFAGGYNEALKQIEAQYYILLNSDVEVTPGWIEPILRLLDANHSIAACMPKLKNFHDREYFEYAGAAGGFIDKYGYTFCRGRIFRTLEKDIGQYDDNISIFWATGACMFIRGELFHSLGGFDASFFAHMEEVDLCWRFKSAGYTIMYSGESTVYHVGGGALPKENPRKTYLNFRNSLFLLYKNLPASKFRKIILLKILFDIGAGFKFLFSLKGSHFFSVIKAHLFFLLKLPSLCKLSKISTNKVHPEIYQKSIVIDYFGRNKKYFNSLNFN
jgi:hypothetical protein